MSKENLEVKERKLKTIVWISTISIIGLWVLTYFLLKRLDFDERGTLGDMFGSINALFSGLALAGIIFSILLQQIELGYQREELKETRKEFAIQNETLKKQRFETTLFNLIKGYNDVVLNLTVDETKDKEAFKRLYDFLNSKLEEELRRLEKAKGITYRLTYDQLTEEENFQVLIRGYPKFYLQREHDFGHYLRVVYNLLDFIDKNELITENERLFYARIFIDQISSPELLLLFYQCYYGRDFSEIYPLQKKYELIKNINVNRLIIRDHYEMTNSQIYSNHFKT